MIHSSDYRQARYVMIAVVLVYVFLFLFSIWIGNPLFKFPGYLLSWLGMTIFLVSIILIHPLHRRWIVIPYILSQIGVLIYSYESLSFMLKTQIQNPFSWIGFTIHLVSYALGLLAMILPLFIFLRKDMYQKPFTVLAISALIFQIISQSWYGLFLINNMQWFFFYLNAIRYILSIIPFISIIYYAIDAKKIQQILQPNHRLHDDSDDEMFGWLTLGIYTIYLSINKPYKK